MGEAVLKLRLMVFGVCHDETDEEHNEHEEKRYDGNVRFLKV